MGKVVRKGMGMERVKGSGKGLRGMRKGYLDMHEKTVSTL